MVRFLNDSWPSISSDFVFLATVLLALRRTYTVGLLYDGLRGFEKVWHVRLFSQICRRAFTWRTSARFFSIASDLKKSLSDSVVVVGPISLRLYSILSENKSRRSLLPNIKRRRGLPYNDKLPSERRILHFVSKERISSGAAISSPTTSHKVIIVTYEDLQEKSV